MRIVAPQLGSAARAPVWEVSILTTPEAEDPISEVLLACFCQSPAIYFDCEKNQSTCTIYSDGSPKSALIALLKSKLATIQKLSINIGPGRISIRRLSYKSWAESWKRHFRPIRLAGKVLIKPSWSALKPSKGVRAIVLDPGLSFGTGQHPTTGFCLRELVKARSHGLPQSFLDLGTGSGILAITAAKLGYQPIKALDIDPESVRVAKRNAARNGVSKKLMIAEIDIKTMPQTSRQKYTVICANLMADLLIASRKTILARLQPEGRLIVAGILKREFDAVKNSFASEGLRLVACRSEKEWQSGTYAF